MSIIEVARLAGVSKSTVSRVINDQAGVKPEVIQLVRETMQRMGYSPPLRRRGPKPASRKGIRTGNILLLILGNTAEGMFSMPVFPSLLNGLQSAISESGLNLVLGAIRANEPEPMALRVGQVDGVLIVGARDLITPALLKRFTQIPTVALMRGFEPEADHIDRVLYDNAAVGVTAARYLLKDAPETVAFLNAHPQHPAFGVRGRAFCDAVRAARRECLELISHPDQPESVAIPQMVSRMRSHGVKGVFVATDAQLPTLFHALKQADIEPMRDMKIIACDNEPQFLGQLNICPATIDLNLALVGRRGLQQLMWRIANPNEPNRITTYVEPILIPENQTP